jgi:hypothetical protein
MRERELSSESARGSLCPLMLPCASCVACSAAPFTLGPLCRSCSILLQLCTPSFASSRGNCRPHTLCLGTLLRRMGSVLVSIVRFDHPPPSSTAGGYTFVERRWRCVQHFLFGAKPLRQAVRILLICGWISWILCPATLSLLWGCCFRGAALGVLL